jgi:uncharacterized protein YjbI with pentapeptide repeats
VRSLTASARRRRSPAMTRNAARVIGSLLTLLLLARADWELQRLYLWYGALRSSNLTHRRYRGAYAFRLRLAGHDLSHSDLSSSYLNDASLEKAVLVGTKLRNANLGTAELLGARLDGSDLRDVDAHSANFSGADLRNADLRGGSFVGAWFQGSDLRGADLRGADLRAAGYDDATKWPAGFDPVKAECRHW